MRRTAVVVAVLTGLIAPAFAQRAEIEAVNAKWVDFFNKGDFAGVASLYTEDATAFPPGAGLIAGPRFKTWNNCPQNYARAGIVGAAPPGGALTAPSGR